MIMQGPYSVIALLLFSKTCNRRVVSSLCLHPYNTTVIHECCDTDCEARLNFVNWCLFGFTMVTEAPHLFCLAGYLCFSSISAQTLRLRGTCVLGWVSGVLWVQQGLLYTPPPKTIPKVTLIYYTYFDTIFWTLVQLRENMSPFLGRHCNT